MSRVRARGGIGIRVRLRSVWVNPWEFKSPRAHQTKKPSGFFVWWARASKLLCLRGRLERRSDVALVGVTLVGVTPCGNVCLWYSTSIQLWLRTYFFVPKYIKEKGDTFEWRLFCYLCFLKIFLFGFVRRCFRCPFWELSCHRFCSRRSASDISYQDFGGR